MRRARQAALASIIALVIAPLDAGAATSFASSRDQRSLGTCTMAVPPQRATVEAAISNPADFCEIFSHALSSEVFRAPVVVTSGLRWHYAGARVSCQLEYQHSTYLLTIWNSAVACGWIERPATGWHATYSALSSVELN